MAFILLSCLGYRSAGVILNTAQLLLQISGLTFFMVAVTGAISVITAFLAAMYGTSAVGIYAAVTLVNSNSRLQDSQQRRGGNIRYHHD